MIIGVDGAYTVIVRALLDAGASIHDVANVSSRCNCHVVIVVFVMYDIHDMSGISICAVLLKLRQQNKMIVFSV